MASLDLEIREKLARYLGDEISLQEFRDWFLPQGWNVDRRAAASTAELAHEVELLLSEFDHGDWTESELRERFIPLLTAYLAIMGEPTISTQTASQVQWVALTPVEPAAARFEFADIRFVEASA